MRITNIQKRELSDIIRQFDLNTNDFETSGIENEFKIKYKYEYFSFLIRCRKQDRYTLIYQTIHDNKNITLEENWKMTKSRFMIWVKDVAWETNTSSGWDSFQNQDFLKTNINEFDVEFSDYEKKQLVESIKELKEKVRLLKISEESLKLLEIKLDELYKKVNTLSKFDWRSFFIGTMANFAMTMVIPPEVNGLLWQYIESSFNHLRSIQ